jgi:hypothetical protein
MTETAMGGATVGMPQRAPIEFAEAPKSLHIKFDHGSYQICCGVVMGDQGKPVLVAVYRHKGAQENIGFMPTALSFLGDVSKHRDVVRANLQWRLPESEAELQRLVSGLDKS